MQSRFFFGLLALAFGSAAATPQARGYSHGFERGNLIPNWSFEAHGQAWDPAMQTAGFTVTPRFPMASLGVGAKAVSGAFAGRVTGTATASNSQGHFNLGTPWLPLRQSVYMYVVSMSVRSSDVAGTVSPAIRFYREKDVPSSQVDVSFGEAYVNNADWTLYKWYVYLPSDANWFQLSLVHTTAQGAGGTFNFDDVVMEEFGFTPRVNIRESVAYADALGRSYSGQTEIGGSKTKPYPGWSRSGRIRVNTTSTGANIKGNVQGFPLLVRLSSTNFTFSEAKANGEDIRFTDAGGNPLTYEMEMWNTTSQVAAIWVNVPEIEGNRVDNDIYMHWGNSGANSESNPSGVFNTYSGYHTVYHMGETPAGTGSIRSATLPDRHATPFNMTSASRVAGRIGYNLDFDGANDYLHAKWNPDESSSTLTFSSWIKLRPMAAGTARYLYDESQLETMNCSSSPYRAVSIVDNQIYIDFGFESEGRWRGNFTFNPDNTTYYHVGLSLDSRVDPPIPALYINGSAVTLTTIVTPDAPNQILEGSFSVGGSCWTNSYFNGAIDEYRIESSLRNRDWLKLAYEVEKAGSAVVNLDRNARADNPIRLQSGGLTYDKFGRPERAYLPCSTPAGDIGNPADGSCALDPDMPNMGGYNYAQSVYTNEPGARSTEVGMPGNNNRLGSGHTLKSDYYYVASLAVPANIETPPTAGAADTAYRFTWRKDPDGNFALEWINRRGQTVQTAANINRNANPPNEWQWNTTRYEYYRDGSLKKTLTPADNAGLGNFAETNSYTSEGLTRTSYSPDRGLVKHWYNRSGQVRFTQDAGQRSGSGYTFQDYDSEGRLISTGTQSITGTLDQAFADQNAYVGGSKFEKIGFLYDNLSNFQTRTGVSLATVIPDSYTYKSEILAAQHGAGRLLCKYHRNADNPLAGMGASDKLVAEFFQYNRQGQLDRIFKYVGPIRSYNHRFQEAYYYYDHAGRIQSETVYRNAFDYNLSSYHEYRYDEKGRLEKIVGNYGSEPIAEFSYTSFGPVKSVILGGDGTGATGTRIEYAYHTTGTIKEIRALQLGTGKLIFQQQLGFDGKANSNAKVPANTARFNGQITQQLYKFAEDLNFQRPVRLVNYNFDELGRMTEANYQRNTGSNPLNSDGTINFNAFNFEESGDFDSYMTYDANSRITSQRSGGSTTAATYHYASNSYKLDRVQGTLTPGSDRNMSAPGTFVYNNRAAMTQDKSKDLTISYDWNIMPVKFVQGAVGNPGYYHELYDFYDADGDRVSSFKVRVQSGSSFLYHGKHYVNLGRKTYKEWEESFAGNGTSISYTSETTNLFGPGNVGRHNRGDTEYYLFNHQGSLMMTVDASGNEPNQGRTAKDYLSFGDYRKLVDNGAQEPITQSYTGKEFEDQSKLYLFGLRYFDAELGIWISQDPFRQYFNPYFYGPDPISGVDPNGGSWISVLKVASGLAPVVNLVSAIKSASEQDSFVEGLWAFGADFIGNTAGDAVSPAMNSFNMGLAPISEFGAFVQAIHASATRGDHSEWGQMGKAIGMSLWAPIASDVVTFNNAIEASRDGNFLDAFQGLGASGGNGLMTGFTTAEYGLNKGFGSQRYTYEGIKYFNDGYGAMLWTQPTNSTGANARASGAGIILDRGYFASGHSNFDKQTIFMHESVHVRQSASRGMGGMFVAGFKRKSDPNPTIQGWGANCFATGGCTLQESVFETYSNDGSLNLLEYEAELEQNQGTGSRYWYNGIPIY